MPDESIQGKRRIRADETIKKRSRKNAVPPGA